MSDELDDFIGPVSWAEWLHREPDPRSVIAHEHLKHWNSFLDQPWAPPESLVAAIDKLERDDPVIWLNGAVDLMAFGVEATPTDGIECGARRQQASRALCEGARRGKFKLIAGAKGNKIKRSRFDLALRLGGTENTLEIDRASARCKADVEFDRPIDGWNNVRIKPASDFVSWLGALVGKPVSNQPAEAPKLSKVAKVEKFKEWRAGQTNIPTAAQDIAHMKLLGVGREEVRNLRKSYLNRRRGRPSTK